jgi:hypothetical protein
MNLKKKSKKRKESPAPRRSSRGENDKIITDIFIIASNTGKGKMRREV